MGRGKLKDFVKKKQKVGKKKVRAHNDTNTAFKVGRIQLGAQGALVRDQALEESGDRGKAVAGLEHLLSVTRHHNKAARAAALRGLQTSVLSRPALLALHLARLLLVVAERIVDEEREVRHVAVGLLWALAEGIPARSLVPFLPGLCRGLRSAMAGLRSSARLEAAAATAAVLHVTSRVAADPAGGPLPAAAHAAAAALAGDLLGLLSPTAHAPVARSVVAGLAPAALQLGRGVLPATVGDGAGGAQTATTAAGASSSPGGALSYSGHRRRRIEEKDRAWVERKRAAFDERSKEAIERRQGALKESVLDGPVSDSEGEGDAATPTAAGAPAPSEADAQSVATGRSTRTSATAASLRRAGSMAAQVGSAVRLTSPEARAAVAAIVAQGLDPRGARWGMAAPAAALQLGGGAEATSGPMNSAVAQSMLVCPVRSGAASGEAAGNPSRATAPPIGVMGELTLPALEELQALWFECRPDGMSLHAAAIHERACAALESSAAILRAASPAVTAARSDRLSAGSIAPDAASHARLQVLQWLSKLLRVGEAEARPDSFGDFPFLPSRAGDTAHTSLTRLNGTIAVLMVELLPTAAEVSALGGLLGTSLTVGKRQRQRADGRPAVGGAAEGVAEDEVAAAVATVAASESKRRRRDVARLRGAPKALAIASARSEKAAAKETRRLARISALFGFVEPLWRWLLDRLEEVAGPPGQEPPMGTTRAAARFPTLAWMVTRLLPLARVQDATGALARLARATAFADPRLLALFWTHRAVQRWLSATPGAVRSLCAALPKRVWAAASSGDNATVRELLHLLSLLSVRQSSAAGTAAVRGACRGLLPLLAAKAKAPTGGTCLVIGPIWRLPEQLQHVLLSVAAPCTNPLPLAPSVGLLRALRTLPHCPRLAWSVRARAVAMGIGLCLRWGGGSGSGAAVGPATLAKAQFLRERAGKDQAELRQVYPSLLGAVVQAQEDPSQRVPMAAGGVTVLGGGAGGACCVFADDGERHHPSEGDSLPLGAVAAAAHCISIALGGVVTVRVAERAAAAGQSLLVAEAERSALPLADYGPKAAEETVITRCPRAIVQGETDIDLAGSLVLGVCELVRVAVEPALLAPLLQAALAELTTGEGSSLARVGRLCLSVLADQRGGVAVPAAELVEAAVSLAKQDHGTAAPLPAAAVQQAGSVGSTMLGVLRVCSRSGPAWATRAAAQALTGARDPPASLRRLLERCAAATVPELAAGIAVLDACARSAPALVASVPGLAAALEGVQQRQLELREQQQGAGDARRIGELVATIRASISGQAVQQAH